MTEAIASTRQRTGWVRALVGSFAAILLGLGGVVATGVPAQAATASVSISPSTATAESNVPVTFTLSVTCNGPGTCNGLQASFPAAAVTGNAGNTDLSSWIGASSCAGVTRSVSGGQVIFTYPTLSPGTQACNFPVRAPEYTTLNGAQATLTPTVSGPVPTATGAPATLTLTAGHNASMGAGAPNRVLPGAEVVYSVSFVCGGNREYTGDIGLSALHFEAVLPANFVYSGFTPRNALPGTFTSPTVGASGGTLVYDDPTGASCGNPPLTVDNSIVVTIRGTLTGGAGTQGCISASSSFTYIDRSTPDTAAPATSPCTTVVELDTQITKTVGTRTLGNAGQYTSGGNVYPYTFPGDWDQSAASVYYDIRVSTVPTSTASGLSYLINDPLPCLDNVSGNAYVSNAVGVPCANPAFLPTRVTVTGFAPTAADALRLLRADGTTTTVPFAAGGWAMPTTGSPVSEIEFPAFAGEGSNTAGVIAFRVTGSAASTAVPGRLMRNTSTSQPYLSGTSDTLGNPETSSSTVHIVDQGATAGDVGRTIIQPSLAAAMTGTCTANIGLRNGTTRNNYLEITKAPSEAIYIDYLAPAGATVTSSTTITAQIVGASNGRTYSTGAMAATQVPNYNGTNRTLYRWVVPAGVVLVPGLYQITFFNLTLDLGAGCSGTYQNDVTIGYGEPIHQCIFNNYVSASAQDAPLYPTANTQLRANASPVDADNYCGYSAPLNLAAINPGFGITKTVQGSLDASPVPGGTTGTVGASGGEATYAVTFTNSGQSNLTDPVIYDILPRLGDTDATSTGPRNSQYAVRLLLIGTMTAGVTVEYSTASNPCRPEVLPPGLNPGCVDDWSSTAPAPLSSATALRFIYPGTLFVAGGGISSFSVSFDVSTPAIADGAIAWNSVGANADAGGSSVGAAESTLVGLEADGQPTIVKAAGSPTYDAVGGTMDFTYTVTNESGVPVADVSVADQFLDAASGSTPGSISCTLLSGPAGACAGTTTDLQPGQTAVFVMSYTIRQADLDHGQIVDRATVTAEPARGAPLSNTSNLVTVTAVQSPALSLAKSVTPTVVDDAGDAVAYSFLLTNTGNVTLASLSVSELVFGGSGGVPLATCPAGPLAPTASVTCTAGYTFTQDDMDAGSVTNTAVAAAEFDGSGVLSASSSATVTATQTPSLDLVKTADVASLGAAGQAVTYSFLVTNDGNVTIDGIDVQDFLFSGTGTPSAITCPGSELGPADDMTCTMDYVATQADIDSGSLDNSARVIGDDPGGVTVPTPPTSDISIPVLFAPALSIVKTADVNHVSRPGAVIHYEFRVINNGNTTLSGLRVDETSFSGAGTLSAIACPVSVLAPTAQATCTADYTVVAGDARAARLSNSARAVASYSAAGAPVAVTSVTSTAVVAVDPGTRGLAMTGSNEPTWAAGLAGSAVLLGGLLTLLSWRRRVTYTHQR